MFDNVILNFGENAFVFLINTSILQKYTKARYLQTNDRKFLQ